MISGLVQDVSVKDDIRLGAFGTRISGFPYDTENR
jgi:hypothetical protein